ncbi:MAG: iron ABC transporter permease [Chloroflexi bacterium]|nr:iron ABC transporter permease [Chloroflexota bacterium]
MRVRALWLLAGLVVLGVLMMLSVAIGSRDVSWSEIMGGLGGSIDGLGQAAVAKRIPRTLLAMLVGAALAVAGCALQGVTRNPLADPGILGINMGASLAVLIGIVALRLVAPEHYIWIAIIGAGLASVFVYTVGSLGRGGATPLKLALAGAATAAALSSFTTAVVLPLNDVAGTFRSWQVGGVGGATYAAIGQVLPFLAIGFLVCLGSARALDTLALGDELAAGLGERVAVARVTSWIGAVVLCGAATAVAGPVVFVGLIVPHLCRLLIGVDHRWLMPASAIVGAGLLTASDVVGRIIARPSEVDVGIITAFIGAPVFIHIVRRQKVRAL